MCWYELTSILLLCLIYKYLHNDIEYLIKHLLQTSIIVIQVASKILSFL